MVESSPISSTGLQIFNNDEFGSVRVIMVDNEPWFVGRDVAEALSYQKPSNAVTRHVDQEDKRVEIVPYTQNGETVGKLIFINESGLYSLILSSKLPSAKRFKHWVTADRLSRWNADSGQNTKCY